MRRFNVSLGRFCVAHMWMSASKCAQHKLFEAYRNVYSSTRERLIHLIWWHLFLAIESHYSRTHSHSHIAHFIRAFHLWYEWWPAFAMKIVHVVDRCYNIYVLLFFCTLNHKNIYSICVRCMSMTHACQQLYLLLLLRFHSHFTSAFFYWQSFRCWMRINGEFLLLFFSLACVCVCMWCFVIRVCMRMIDRAKRNLGFIVKQ